ncbi:MAG: deoxyribonuclease V, partial [Anaerolineae bacterium]
MADYTREPHPLHDWNLSPAEAVRVQQALRHRVRFEPLPLTAVRRVAGVDVGFPRGRGLARAAVVVLEFPSLRVIEYATAQIPTPFPYVPGLLSFREMPVILAALERLDHRPDVFLVDGHGLAHPRRFGLACHLGVWLDAPAIGCAKSILVGDAEEPSPERGAYTPLVDDGETIGLVLRTRARVRPVYISVGHRVDLESARQVVLACGSGYRLPEPIRQAHRLAGRK